jgi:uncharacterized membrane protein (UPF0127 family)
LPVIKSLRFGRALLAAAVVCLSGPGLTACKAAPPAEVLISPLETLSIETAAGQTLKFQVEIADDDRERQNGLMYRRSLAPDRGMLFDFGQAGPRSFWMKNTYIPLDILYIGADGYILSIAAMTEPFSESPIPSHGPALGVLEIAGGRAGELGIRPGDRVRHRIFPNG